MMLKNKSYKQDLIKEFILENKDSLYRVSYSYMKNKDDALDAVQDCICKSLSSANRLKDTDSVKPWVYRILVNTCIDTLKRSNKVININHNEEDNSYFYYDSYTDVDLKRALDSLDPKYKSIIILRYFEDLKIKDIAKILDKNENTIKTMLYKALDMLKIKLK